MDFQITVDAFKKFLHKCQLSGAIKDLLLQSTNESLFAKFSDSNGKFYCEVYEKNLKITEAGTIRIAKLDQVLAVLSRTESEFIRVKSTENMYVITDGQAVGKMRVDLTPAGGADLLESYERIRPLVEDKTSAFFDKDALEYAGGKIKYGGGYEVPISALNTILKDAKAFKIELYKLYVGKDGLFTCAVEDQSTGQAFIRRIQTIQKLGDGTIPTVILGSGFREMVNAIEKESDKLNVKLLFAEESVLLTDGSTFFYNLHTVLEN